MQDFKNIIPGEEETSDDDKKVEVPQSILEQMQKEIDELKTKVKKQEVLSGENEEEDDDNKKAIARLREYDKKLVVGFNKKRGTWQKWDKERREDILMQEIYLLEDDGTETPVEVDYLKFMNDAKIINLPIIKKEKKEVVEEKGFVNKKEVQDWRTVVKNDKVQQKVILSDDYVTLQLPNGKEKTISVDFINF